MPLTKELQPIFHRLEASETLADEAVAVAIAALQKRLGEIPEELSMAFDAERFVDTLTTDETGERGPWGIYFKPAFMFIDDNGMARTSHAIEKVTPEVIRYWSERAVEARHPKLKARYADGAREFSSVIRGASRDIQNARTAIDSYIANVNRFHDMYPHINSLKRALNLALGVRDDGRIGHVIQAMFDLYERACNSGTPGAVLAIFDTLFHFARSWIFLLSGLAA